MNLAVTVLHNVGRDMFLGFNPQTSSLYHAHTFQVVADNVNEAAELVWTLTNVGHPRELPTHLSLYGNQVNEYRARRNRSLSVGDVLVMEDLDGERIAGVMACETVGWKGLEFLPEWRQTQHGFESDSYRAHQQNYL